MAYEMRYKLHTINFRFLMPSWSNLSSQSSIIFHHHLPLQANGKTEAADKVTKIQLKKDARRTEKNS